MLLSLQTCQQRHGWITPCLCLIHHSDTAAILEAFHQMDLAKLPVSCSNARMVFPASGHLHAPDSCILLQTLKLNLNTVSNPVDAPCLSYNFQPLPIRVTSAMAPVRIMLRCMHCVQLEAHKKRGQTGPLHGVEGLALVQVGEVLYTANTAGTAQAVLCK